MSISLRKVSLSCLPWHRGRMGRQDKRSFHGWQGTILSAWESGMGIPLWLQHRGHRHCKVRLYDPLFFPLVYRCTCVHTEELGGSSTEWEKERGKQKGRGGGTERTLRWVKHIEKAAAHVKTPDSTGPNNPCVLPFLPSPPRKTGLGRAERGLAFFVKRQFLHFRSRDNHGYITIVWQTQWQRLTREEVLSPPFVLLLLEQPHAKVQPPSRHMGTFQGSWNCLFVQG